MPGHYQRKITKGMITTEQLHTAIEAVNEGLSIRDAAERFGVPKSTVFKYSLKPEGDRRPRIENKTTIPPSIETELVKYALKICRRFFGLTPQ
jgi:transposase